MKKRQCYLCNSADFKQITDELRKGERIPILECSKCGLIFLDTTHPNFINEEYINKDYLFRNSQLYGKGDIEEYDKSRMNTYKVKAEEILPQLHSKSDVLEVGCGCGSFLSLIYKHVNKTVGIEINKSLADYARDKLKIPVYTEPIEEIQLNEKFDVIFLLQVIDHLSDPLRVLKKVKGLLKSDGFIFIECPNTAEALMRYLPENSLSKHQQFHYHLAHLWYFNKATIEKLFSMAGLKCSIRNVHDWTFLNFLNWWFLGTPSESIEEAQLGIRLYKNQELSSQYMKDMNCFFEKIDGEFRNILAKHCLASTFVCEARL